MTVPSCDMICKQKAIYWWTERRVLDRGWEEVCVSLGFAKDELALQAAEEHDPKLPSGLVPPSKIDEC